MYTSHVSNDNFSKITSRFEFYEAIARMVDEIEIGDVNELIKNVNINIDCKFKELDLGDKLWIITALILDKIIKEKT